MDAIVAVYADWGIGAKGTQPLVIPADRRRYHDKLIRNICRRGSG